MIKIPVEIGDTILTGKFKNKAVVVKTIGTDDHGMATINGKKVVTFRIKKEEKLGESKMATQILEGFLKNIVRMTKLAKEWSDKADKIYNIKSMAERSLKLKVFHAEIKAQAQKGDDLQKKFFNTMLKSLEDTAAYKAAVKYQKTIGENKLNEGMVMISSLLPVGGLIGMPPKRVDNFEFKGLPGQFDKDGNKILDEMGQPVEKKEVVKEAVMDAKYYKNLLADVEDGLSELVAVGEDYEIFQSAKYAKKALKQAYKLVNSVK